MATDHQDHYPYQNVNPGPFTSTESINEKVDNKHKLRYYSKSMLDAYRRTKMKSYTLWTYFAKGFRSHTIQSWYIPMHSELHDLMTTRGI